MKTSIGPPFFSYFTRYNTVLTISTKNMQILHHALYLSIWKKLLRSEKYLSLVHIQYLFSIHSSSFLTSLAIFQNSNAQSNFEYFSSSLSSFDSQLTKIPIFYIPLFELTSLASSPKEVPKPKSPASSSVRELYSMVLRSSLSLEKRLNAIDHLFYLRIVLLVLCTILRNGWL